MDEDLKLIQVMGKGNDNKVAFWERHIDHWNGEAFVSNDGLVYEVAETPAVKAALGEGRLVTGGDMRTFRVGWNSKVSGPVKTKPSRVRDVPVTKVEEDKGEKKTAKVTE